MKEDNTKELIDFILANKTPYDVTVGELFRDGFHPNFFRKDSEMERFNADNNKLLNGLSFKDKNDHIYVEALEKATTSISMRFPDFYDDIILIIVSSGYCSSKQKAYLYSTAGGFLPMLEIMSSSECKSTKMFVKMTYYLQRWIPITKGSAIPKGLNSLSSFNTKVDVDRSTESTNDLYVSYFKMIASIIGTLSEINNVPKKELYRLMMNCSIIKSYENGENIFDEGHYETAIKDRDLFLSAIEKTSKIYTRETLDLYRSQKQFLKEDSIKYVEQVLRAVDKLFGSVHCKYCLSHNTKIRRRFPLEGKDQYECMDCTTPSGNNRLFTIKLSTKESREEFFKLADSVVESSTV